MNAWYHSKLDRVYLKIGDVEHGMSRDEARLLAEELVNAACGSPGSDQCEYLKKVDEHMREQTGEK